MKCHKCQADVLQQFKFCQACGTTLNETSDSEKETKKLMSFEDYRKKIASRKNEKSCSGPTAKKKKSEPTKEVLVNVGLMKINKGELKPIKGKTMPVA